MDAVDIAVTSRNGVYMTEPGKKRIWFADPAGQVRAVYEGAITPTGVRLSPDEHLLLVSDSSSRSVWSFEIQPDGGLTNAEPFYSLEATGGAMTLDDTGHLYVASSVGIQICDQPGRVVGIICAPSSAPITALAFGNPNLDYLYASAGGKLYRRHTRRKGVLPWVRVQLPRPQL
jgi:sugar lactone lactonase YvrE